MQKNSCACGRQKQVRHRKCVHCSHLGDGPVELATKAEIKQVLGIFQEMQSQNAEWWRVPGARDLLLVLRGDFGSMGVTRRQMQTLWSNLRACGAVREIPAQFAPKDTRMRHELYRRDRPAEEDFQ